MAHIHHVVQKIKAMVTVAFLLVCLGLFQAIMQGLMFYNSLRFLDSYIPLGIKWFDKGADNKEKWHILLRGKKYFVFKYFPFIMFADFFHFAHGMFGLFLGTCVAYLCLPYFSQPIVFLIFLASAFTYSTVFHYSLLFMKKVEKKNSVFVKR